VRDQFLVEITEQVAAGISGLPELNRLFSAWVETVYHTAVHSETGLAPLARWRAGIPNPLPLPSPAQLREAFCVLGVPHRHHRGDRVPTQQPLPGR
jgi:putative transposase